jgi:transcription elongation factor GreA
MYDRLTKSDIEKIEKEIYERTLKAEELNEAVKAAKAFGDLSENFEYYAAKRERNMNAGRIKYLENMKKTATIIEDKTAADQVGLNDEVELYIIEDDDTMTITLVTTILVNPEEDRYSIDSPIGRAIHGKRVGDECVVQPEDGEPYTVRIVSVTPVDGEKFDIAGY